MFFECAKRLDFYWSYKPLFKPSKKIVFLPKYFGYTCVKNLSSKQGEKLKGNYYKGFSGASVLGSVLGDRCFHQKHLEKHPPKHHKTHAPNKAAGI